MFILKIKEFFTREGDGVVNSFCIGLSRSSGRARNFFSHFKNVSKGISNLRGMETIFIAVLTRINFYWLEFLSIF